MFILTRRRSALGSRAVGALLLAAWLPITSAAEVPLPRRDLLIELREADLTPAPAGAPGWSVRSADATAPRERPAQQLRVRNGASAGLRLTVTRPLQVWQAGPGVARPVPVPATQWIEAGQRLLLQPRWPGGREPVAVALSADSSRLDPHVAPGSAELPQRTAALLVTTVSAPLGQWVSVASTGGGDEDGTVVASGQAAAVARRVLQLRVTLAP